MIWEVVMSGATGISGSNTGNGSGAGAGAGAGFGAAFFFGFGFGFMSAAAKAARQHNAIKRPQTQLFMKEPDEPDWSHPELGPDPEESTMDESSLREADTKESEDAPLLPEEESHGVRVVVLAASVMSIVNDATAGVAAAAGVLPVTASATLVTALSTASTAAAIPVSVDCPVVASPSMIARIMRDDITKKKALTT